MADLSRYARKDAPGAFDRAMVLAPPDVRESRRVTFEDAQLTGRAGAWLDAQLTPDGDQVLDARTLNERYGVEGRLSFSKAETRASADYKSWVAAKGEYRDKALSAHGLSGADAMWQSLKGGLLDPVALPTYFIGIGELRGGAAVGQAGVAIGRNRLIASGMARGALENIAGGAVYEAGNYGLRTAGGEDYDFGQAADNLVFGTVLGAGLGGLGGHLRAGREAKAATADAAFDALINTESRGRQFDGAGNPLTSPKGAIGVAQVMPGTAPEAAKLAGLAWDETRYKTDADYNAALGRAYFTKQVADFGGDIDKAWAAYNAGPGRVRSAVKKHGADWLSVLPKETQDYVARNRGLVGDGVAAPAAPVASGLDRLSPSEKAGTFEAVYDQFLDDTPVDVAPWMPKPREFRAIDDGAFSIDLPGRVYQPDVAITTRGQEVPVRYAVVDLKDVVTSHSDDLEVNGAYPAELQPRARDRAGAVARNRKLEGEMHPGLLLSDKAASGGAPIMGRDGVILSGNGRTIALRRSAVTGGETYARYRAALAADGYDLSGMEHPVLVRANASDMSHGDLLRFTKDANDDPVERMSASEQARVDAARLPDEALSLIDGPDFASAGNRGFVKAFNKHAAPDALNALTDKDGNVSAEGIRRVKAALLNRAYDNPRLVEKLFEDADPNIKSIGRALQDAAPGMARLKSLIALGRVAPEADLTADLNRALDLIMEARDGLRPLRDLILERIDQADMLTGDAMSEAQIGFLRAMFKDQAFIVGRSVEDMTRAFDDYSRRAAEVSEGLDLFGRDALSRVRDSLQDALRALDDGLTLSSPGGDKRVFSFRSDAEKTHGDFVAALASGGDAGGNGGRKPEPAGAKAADGPAGSRSAPRDAGAAAQALIASDPELMALQDDIAVLDPAGELTLSPKDKPETVAEALRAVAFCMIEGGVK